MIPVYQTNITPNFGNCQQAAIASLLDLELDMVPNFIKYQSGTFWTKIYYNFLLSFGYEYYGPVHLTKWIHKFERSTFLDPERSINGFFEARVPSKTFEGGSHAVIIDITGLVVHDPNPNKLWLNRNPLESGENLEIIMLLKVNQND